MKATHWRYVESLDSGGVSIRLIRFYEIHKTACYSWVVQSKANAQYYSNRLAKGMAVSSLASVGGVRKVLNTGARSYCHNSLGCAWAAFKERKRTHYKHVKLKHSVLQSIVESELFLSGPPPAASRYVMGDDDFHRLSGVRVVEY